MLAKSYHPLIIFHIAVLQFVASATAESGFFDSEGVRIHYSFQGKGDPIISLHGWLDSGQQTLKSAPMLRLARNFRVIAPDLRGHGNSGKPQSERQYGPEMVRDVVRLMDHLRIRRAHVIGHSMGGMIVARLLVDHPQRARSAVISGSGAIREGKGYDKRFVHAFARAVARGVPTGYAIIGNWHLTGGAPLDKKERRYLLSLNRTDGRAFAAVAKSWKQLEVSDNQLEQVPVPTLVIRGQYDTRQSRSSMAELARLLPQGILRDVPRGTHTTTPTLPEYTQLVEQFLLTAAVRQ